MSKRRTIPKHHGPVQPLVPPYASPPGHTLLELINSLGLSQTDLAARMGRPIKTINEIIKGKARITEETAIQLEERLGAPAHFWLSMETNYRLALARKKHTR